MVSKAVPFLADDARGEGLGGHTVSESDCFAPTAPNEKFNVRRGGNRHPGRVALTHSAKRSTHASVHARCGQ